MPSILIVKFVCYSFIGWIWETIYCAIVDKKFSNRGFLFGPICPIYGTGAALLEILYTYFFSDDVGTSPARIFFICFFGSMVLEYSVSWYLEKRFHARWWDYSDLPLNVNGRICLFASIGFGAAGVALCNFLYPFVYRVEGMLFPAFFEIFAVVLAFLFGADFALTEASLHSLLEKIQALEDEFEEKGERARVNFVNAPEQLREKVKETRKSLMDKGEEMQEARKRFKDKEEEMQEAFALRIKNTAANLNFGQKHLLGNMRKFKSVKALRMKVPVAQRLKEMLRK